MAFSVIASAINIGGASGATTTPGVDSTGADLIVGLQTFSFGAVNPQFGDNKGNAYVGLTLAISTSPNSRLFRSVPQFLGSGHTWNVSGTNVFAGPAAIVLAGAAASPFDQETTRAVATVNSIAPGAITPSEDNCILITGMAVLDLALATTVSINNGFTIAKVVNAQPQAYGYAIAYKIQTTAEVANPTWSWNTANTCTAVMASFKSLFVPPPPVIYTGPIVTLGLGNTSTLVEDVTYTLPPKRLRIMVFTSGGTIETSEDGNNWTPVVLPASKEFTTSAKFIHCIGANAIITVKSFK